MVSSQSLVGWNRAPDSDTGVRQHDVGGSEFGRPLLERLAELGHVSDVGLSGADAPSLGFDLLGGLLEVGGSRHGRRPWRSVHRCPHR